MMKYYLNIDCNRVKVANCLAAAQLAAVCYNDGGVAASRMEIIDERGDSHTLVGCDC